MQNKDWFIKRVGKRVFRDDDGCSCQTCENVVKNGIVIMDEFHAKYMFDVQNDWMVEGTKLNYRDKK
jgi:hypothetical protein